MITWPKFLWATDIHLDHIHKDKIYRNFFNKISSSKEEFVFFSGDISTYEIHERKQIPKLKHHLEMISKACINKHAFFVLGNHDYWFSKIENVRNDMKTITNQFPNLHWLGESEPIQLDEETFLVGHDGWYDLRLGSLPTNGMMNDWNYISNFRKALLKTNPEIKLIQECQNLAGNSTSYIKNNINNAIKNGAKKVIILTHFPPFKENSRDGVWIGCYTNHDMGLMLRNVAKNNPDINFLVLCGHAHISATHQAEANLVCLTGGAEYTRPEIQPPLENFLQNMRPT